MPRALAPLDRLAFHRPLAGDGAAGRQDSPSGDATAPPRFCIRSRVPREWPLFSREGGRRTADCYKMPEGVWDADGIIAEFPGRI